MKALYTNTSPYLFEETNSGAHGSIPTEANPFPSRAYFSPNIEKGYDAKAPRLTENRRDNALKQANGRLTNPKWHVDFFVKNVEIGISLGGETAQRRFTRDFLPRNFRLPSFQVECQCLDQRDYAGITEFIHICQQEAVFNGTQTQLLVKGGGLDKKGNFRHMRGHRDPIVAAGFVPSIDRQYQQFVYAPTFTFEFTVVEMIEGIYQEVEAKAAAQQGWKQIIEGIVPIEESSKENSQSKEKSSKGNGSGTYPVPRRVNNSPLGPSEELNLTNTFEAYKLFEVSEEE